MFNQDFYFTIELSDTAPPPRPKVYGNRGGSNGATASNNGATPRTSNREAVQKGAPATQPHKNTRPERFQLLDLHGPNPLISYGDQLYSCRWASAVGTDLFFAKPAPDIVGSAPSTDAEPEVGFIGKTSTRLIAEKVQVFRRPGRKVSWDVRVDGGGEASQRNVQSNGAASPAASSSINASNGEHRQTHFLDRLAAAKRKRGETDTVRMTACVSTRVARDAPAPELDNSNAFTPGTNNVPTIEETPNVTTEMAVHPPAPSVSGSGQPVSGEREPDQPRAQLADDSGEFSPMADAMADILLSAPTPASWDDWNLLSGNQMQTPQVQRPQADEDDGQRLNQPEMPDDII